METPKLFMAEVVNNNDSTLPDGLKMNRIQVRLVPEFELIKDEDLPWIRPFMTSSNEAFESPEIGDRVWVVMLDEFYKVMFYWGNMFFDQLVKQPEVYKAVADKVADGGEYPDLKIKRYKDGTCVFRNTKTGNTGIVHPTGTVVSIDAAGKVNVKNGTTSLTAQLKSIQTILTHLTTPGTLIGNLGNPIVYQHAGPDGTACTELATNIAALFKE